MSILEANIKISRSYCDDLLHYYYLGGDPTVKSKEAGYTRDSKTMLEIDLKSAQETIKNYRDRIVKLKVQASMSYQKN